MSDFLLTTESLIRCAHGGVVQTEGEEPRVLVQGHPVIPQPSPATVEGCAGALPAGSGPTGQVHTLETDLPCLMVEWQNGTTRVTSMGQPLLVADSVGIASPSGAPVTVEPVQARVQAM